jgi:hypothetical protein
MAKQNNAKKYVPDLLPAGTIVDVVKIDNNGDFVGLKSMNYGDWKNMKKQAGFTYKAYQKGFSSYKNK